jgi:hypothetical protein
MRKRDRRGRREDRGSSYPELPGLPFMLRGQELESGGIAVNDWEE